MNLCNGIEDCPFFERCKALGKLSYVGGDDDGEHYITTQVNFDKLSLLNLCPRKDFPDNGITFLNILMMYIYVKNTFPDHEVPKLAELVQEAMDLGVYSEFSKKAEKEHHDELDAASNLWSDDVKNLMREEVNAQNGQT